MAKDLDGNGGFSKTDDYGVRVERAAAQLFGTLDSEKDENVILEAVDRLDDAMVRKILRAATTVAKTRKKALKAQLDVWGDL